MTEEDTDKYQNKDLIDLFNKISDDRGFIQPLCDLNMKSASLIYTKQDQWRANHYHKEDWHFIYVINGEFEYYFRKTNSGDETKKKIIKKGDLLFTGPMIDHAMLYTEETQILVLSKNPRDQITYENDTVRIEFMNSNNRF